MVEGDAAMDSVFHALAHDARRDMLGRLAGHELTVGAELHLLDRILAASEDLSERALEECVQQAGVRLWCIGRTERLHEPRQPGQPVRAEVAGRSAIGEV